VGEKQALKFQLARLAQSVERETFNLNVVGSSPTLGALFSTLLFGCPHESMLYCPFATTTPLHHL
jgi:hypothetical protein